MKTLVSDNFASGSMTDRMAPVNPAIVGMSPTRSQDFELSIEESTIGDFHRLPKTPPKVIAPCGSRAGDWFSAADIAQACGTHKKKIHRIATREKWPSRQVSNRLEYQPPAEVAAIVIASPLQAPEPIATPTVKFSDLAHSDEQRAKVLLREKAVKLVEANKTVMGKEMALQLVCNKLAEDFAKQSPSGPHANGSITSLRRWCDKYAAHGIDGLVEQKRGIVGRKAFALDLTPDDILKGQALALGHGAGAKQNIAHGFRKLAADPEVSGPARLWLHNARASKSSVPPSVRKAFRVAPLAAQLITIGPKAMKLDGPFTVCDYSELHAGMAFTADDMTANVYVWKEWPNEQGYIVIRPQILALMDVGTLSWRVMRAVIRAKGQYNRDDVWGLVGDYLDQGLHVDATGKVDMTAIFEGGTWQSNIVKGQKTGLTDESRFGGLKSLGIKLIHTRTPRGKIIETNFNQLQHAADNCPGYCGRDERRDCPETLKAQLAEIRAGKAHPSQYLLHVDQYAEHLARVMNDLNNERNDGQVLRGQTPSEKWTNDQPQFQVFDEKAKWMYRSDFRVSEVTRNGVRVTIGSGKYQDVYYYASPELEIHRGRKVITYWNDYDPDTAAVIYTIQNGKPHQFICTAERVQTIGRLNATKEELTTEAKRKAASMKMAYTVSKQLSPLLGRNQKLVTPKAAQNIGERIAAARAEAKQREKTKANARQYTGDMSDLTEPVPTGRAELPLCPDIAVETNRVETDVQESSRVTQSIEATESDLSTDALLD